MEPSVLSSFPFLKETGSFVRRYGPSPEVLLRSPDYAEVRQDGFLRTLEALGKGEWKRGTVLEEPEALRSVLVYIVSRILVSAVDDTSLIRRFALNEAGRMREDLDAADEDVLEIVAGELGVEYSVRSDGYTVPFAEYLKLSSDRIGGPGGEWKLVNRSVDSGEVVLSRTELTRLLMEEIRRRLEADLPLDVDRDMLVLMGEHVRRLREETALTRTADVGGPPVLGDSPPCIVHLMEDTAAGANLPHHARFALTTFLHTIGMDEDSIMRLFATSPDFQDRIARYQVDHITGVTSGTEYSVPKCETMRSYGICRDPDILCGQMIHPVQYYRTRRKGSDFDAVVKVASSFGPRLTGPRPVNSPGTVDRVSQDTVGRWFEAEVRVRDVRARRVKAGGRWYTAAFPRLTRDGAVPTMPMLDWGLALGLAAMRGRSVTVRGFITSMGSEPLLHIVAAKD